MMKSVVPLNIFVETVRAHTFFFYFNKMFCRVKYLELKKSSRGQEREIKYAGQLVKKRKMKSKSEKKKKKKKNSNQAQP